MKDTKGSVKNVIMLFSMSFLPYQGRYMRVYNEATSLVKAGKKVTIIAWDRDCKSPREEVIEGVRIERIWSRAGFQRGPSNLFSVIMFYLRLFPRLFRKKFDAIHCFNLDTIFPGLFIAKIMGKKAVLDLCEPNYYTNWSNRFSFFISLLQYFERFFSRKFDYLFVHNAYQIKKFREYGVSNIELIGSYPNSSLIKEKVNVQKGNNGKVVIGRLGSIYKNNGIEEMIDAFKKLKEVLPNVKLLLAGRVFEEFREEFDSIVLPLGDAVEIIGEFSPEDLPALYDKTDISLQLSRRTDWFKDITPTKFFETLACGVPVITSDIGDLREIIETCNCGIVVDETSIESVFSGMKSLVEDPVLRLKIAENGLNAVKEQYNWHIMEQKIIKVYETLQANS
ncbi:glycosyltransferase [Candidatus Scalindua japonica]|uniref:Glycosyltransferase n=1 Tax=Candidatus Scalindua japonica TaxID=1284222 RepID=A0A286TX27_9BACT|nr:glycosyltransferase family 4 protein [Candidatus Scalindua japonica]GAX60426.1 glycosyltransferase [Candidatus Scalindua japonica]